MLQRNLLYTGVTRGKRRDFKVHQAETSGFRVYAICVRLVATGSAGAANDKGGDHAGCRSTHCREARSSHLEGDDGA